MDFIRKLVGIDRRNHCLEDFSLQEKVGSGANSVVFRGTDKTTNKEVAIKVVNRTSLRLEERDNLKRESLLLKEIQHPHILNLKEIFEEDYETVLVSEWMKDGHLLSNIQNLEKYSERECRRWMKDLLTGVAHLHSLGVFMRGLHPESILMRNQDIVIADVAFTHQVIDSDVQHCILSSYAPPEILCESPSVLRPASELAAADIWSLGVIFYILLSGEHPFLDMKSVNIDDFNSQSDSTYSRMVQNITQGSVKFDNEVWSELGHSVVEMVSSMLSIDPLERPSAAHLLTDSQWLQSTSQSTLSKTLSCLRLWRMQPKRFKFDLHGSHVAARFDLNPNTSSSSSSSSSSYQNMPISTRADSSMASSIPHTISLNENNINNNNNKFTKNLNKKNLTKNLETQHQQVKGAAPSVSVIVGGDFLQAKESYIIHQCNCVSIGARGIAKAIFAKWPQTNCYKDRILTYGKGKGGKGGGGGGNGSKPPSIPGTIDCVKVGPIDKPQVVVGFFAQQYPGSPKKQQNSNDSRDCRLNWFRQCLEVFALQLPSLHQDLCSSKNNNNKFSSSSSSSSSFFNRGNKMNNNYDDNNIMETSPNIEVAMPYLIGCGLAGGIWSQYEAVIRQWVMKHNITVRLYDIDRKSLL